MAPKESNSDDVVVCCLNEASVSIFFALRIQQGFCWTVSLRGVDLKRDTCPLLTALPESLKSASSIHLLTTRLTTYHVCEGNMEEKFLKLSKLRKGVFTDASVTANCCYVHMCAYLLYVYLFTQGRRKWQGKKQLSVTLVVLSCSPQVQRVCVVRAASRIATRFVRRCTGWSTLTLVWTELLLTAM